MPRKNRDYKKTGYFRDTQLFVIATEGQKREPQYFLALAKGHTRVRVKILKPGRDQKSSPVDVLRRARAYGKEVKLNKDDQMWLVIDTDRWPAKTLHRIAKYCQRKGWGIAISNPCFEVWLYLHKEPLPVEVIYTSQEMKTALGELVVGGYTAEDFVLLLAMAIENAKATDDSVAYNLPEVMRTQLWRLGEALLPFLED